MRSAPGYALLSVVVVVATLLVAAVAAIELTGSELHFTADQVAHERAFYAADAGVQRALAQLDKDRATASASTAYAYGVSETIGGAAYSIEISQDPLYPSDSRRKQIQSTGTLGSQQAVVMAHAFIQPVASTGWIGGSDSTPTPGGPTPTPTPTGPTPAPTSTPLSNPTSDNVCDNLLASYAGTARLATNAAAGSPTLFNGNIFGNQRVSFNILLGGAFNGFGSVISGGDFISNSVASLLTTLSANLYRAGDYVVQGVDAHVGGIPTLGIHFANGPQGHGVQQPVAARRFPRPSYDRIKRNPRTYIVNKDRLPFGTWDAATKTWIYTGLLAFPTSERVIYYVDGNARLGSIELADSSSSMIVARGWLVFDTLSLVTTSLVEGPTVKFARGPGSVSVTVSAVVPGHTQRLVLIAQKELAIGRPVLSIAPLTFDTENQALLNATTGIGLSAANLLLHNYIQAYSETATAWGKISAVDAASDSKVNFCASGDSTLAFNGTVLASVGYYPPIVF